MKCKNCIWNDQCGQDEACEYYDDGSSVSQQDIVAYKKDLLMRAEAYEEVFEDFFT